MKNKLNIFKCCFCGRENFTGFCSSCNNGNCGFFKRVDLNYKLKE